ncbi:diguanylate cyclase [Sodalis-like symbiont of Bactericera trigonica]|nr:diguanylate cyclase [Sodalis-like symbiont of Bactericera trigonica]
MMCSPVCPTGQCSTIAWRKRWPIQHANRTARRGRMCGRAQPCIIDAVKQPFPLGGHNIFIGVSIVVALAPTDAIEKEDLKHKADIALYAAKARGRDGFLWFEQSLDESLRAREVVARDLRAALRLQDALSLHFLPQVDITGV